MTFHLRMKILLLSLLLLFNIRHLSAFSQVLATVLLLKYSNVVFFIFKCILILLMGNIKCYHKTVFYSLFIQTKIKKSKQNKTKLL